MKPTVGVVIPVCNGEAFVGRAMESILAQSGDVEFHVVCVDDGSVDGSVDLVEKFRRSFPRFDLISHSSSKGPGLSRNKGALILKTEFLAFLDQDDRWSADKTTSQLVALEANPKTEFVLGMQCFELEDPNHVPNWFRPEWMESPQPGHVPSALMVRRDFFARSGGFSEHFSTGGDDSGWFAKCIRDKVEYQILSEIVVTRLVHRRNNSRNTAKANKELLQVVRDQLLGRATWD